MLWVGVQMNLKTNIEATKENMRDRSWLQANSLQTLAQTSLFM